MAQKGEGGKLTQQVMHTTSGSHWEVAECTQMAVLMSRCGQSRENYRYRTERHVTNLLFLRVCVSHFGLSFFIYEMGASILANTGTGFGFTV